MFLGTSSMKDSKSYFFPLLPIWKKKAQSGDADYASRVKSLESLPMIQFVTQTDTQGLPESAKIQFSHGAYKIMLATANSGELIFAIRDIEALSTDDSGRKNPFLLVIVANTDGDKHMLERVATYAASHLDTFSQQISVLFNYDSEKNGISFELAQLTAYLNKISKESDNMLLTMKGEVIVDRNKADVPLLILPEGIDKELAAKEQQLSGRKTNFINLLDVVPLDNQKKLIALIRARKQSQTSLLSDTKVLALLAGAAFLGFVLGYFIAK